MVSPEFAENSENRVRSIFMGTFFTLLLLLLNMSYGLMWGILYLVYIDKEINSPTYNDSCDQIVSWGKALYIIQFLSTGLHLVSSIFQLIATSYDQDSNIPKYIMGLRSCLVYIAGMTILLGINVAYFNHANMNLCGSLKNLNLTYIITEWTILGLFICLVCVVCIFTIIFKRRKKNQYGRI